MKVKNLFGEMQELVDLDKSTNKTKSTYAIWKRNVNFRLGSDNKSCKSCRFLIRKEFHGRNYNKCKFIGDTNSTSTDVRLKDVCDLFKRANNA